ncbi:MAG: TonB-dependent receptor [Gemmatimonadetes bacterium]|nr:TonB-dependent receptor [Gemmatimonadota bacterium]
MRFSKSHPGILAALAAAVAFSAPAAAQNGTVTGTVVESPSGRPLAAATVTLRAPGDTAAVAGATTDAAGRFRIQVAPGTYALQASRLGYTTARRAGVTVAGGAATELGSIEVAAATLLLEEVQVVTEAATAIVAADRNIYSTRDMPVAAGGMATDVLRSVPELEVDINGGVQLRGTAAQIYLNGRPAPMQGQSLELFLQQFPADRIDRVEVIANPSARFEAEGAGGIVNIVLKKNVDLGLSGSLFANGSTRGEVGTGGRLAYQRGRLTLFGGGFLRRSDRSTTSYDLRQNLLTQPVTLLQQDGWNDREGVSGNLDLTSEFQLTERTLVRAEVATWRNGWDADGVTLYTEMDSARSITDLYDRASVNRSDRLSTDLSAGLRHNFAPLRRERRREGEGGGDPAVRGRPGGPGGPGRMPGGGPGGFRGGGGGGGGGVSGGGHELSVDVEYETGNDDSWSRVLRRQLELDGGPSALPEQLTLDENDEGEREAQLRADYVRPWGPRGSVELGYQARVQETEEDRVREVFANPGQAVPVASTLTGFGYRETFHSLYGTVSRMMGPVSAQVGLRAERADTRLTVPGMDQGFDKSYFSLFPSANLRWDLGGGRDVRLAYSRRVRRPRPGLLNPVDRSTDPLNRTVGNPDLDPQYTTSLSLETSWTGTFGTLRLSPYYRRTSDDWTQIKRVDEHGVSTVTWENLASVRSYGSSLTASMRAIHGVSGNVSVSGSREVRNASNLSTEYSGDAMRWSARGNVSARLTRRLALQAMGYYTPARDVPQGRISSTFMTHAGVRQSFLKDRATVNLMVTDPFDLYRSSFETRDPTHVQIGRSRFSARQAVLSFSYSFGRPPRDRRTTAEEEQPEEQVIR